MIHLIVRGAETKELKAAQLLNRGASAHALVHKQRTLPQDFPNEDAKEKK